ncbi:MAG: Fic family protein [Verrucomicrobiota bacterium]
MNPPFSITPKILDEISRIERLIGRIESFDQPKPQPYLRKSNRVRTVQGSLAIEGNTLDLEQITALLEGKTVVGKPSEIKEVFNAIEVYDSLPKFDPYSAKSLLEAHRGMMTELIPSAGKWRRGDVGILKGTAVSHVAPAADRVPHLMADLFEFTRSSTHHKLITGCVFHYELEFIHPFEDGNGRIGRFWHSVLLYHYHPVFEFIPVESLIKEHQEAYYTALEQSDRAGHSDAFIEFSLSMIRQSLSDFVDALRPPPTTVDTRLEVARGHFKAEQFSRKDYMQRFKNISSATASRDLRTGVTNKQLQKSGSHAQTVYSFKNG